jgi:hypothetical protein
VSPQFVASSLASGKHILWGMTVCYSKLAYNLSDITANARKENVCLPGGMAFEEDTIKRGWSVALGLISPSPLFDQIVPPWSRRKNIITLFSMNNTKGLLTQCRGCTLPKIGNVTI